MAGKDGPHIDEAGVIGAAFGALLSAGTRISVKLSQRGDSRSVLVGVPSLRDSTVRDVLCGVYGLLSDSSFSQTRHN